MKTVKILVILACVVLMLGSCNSYVFTTKSFYDGYVKTMNSKDENELLEKIHILLTQKELIHADYEVISMNIYAPNALFRFGFIEKMENRFFAKAVEKAEEEGGNAVLISSPGCYSVLKVTNWNGHKPEQLFENPIYSTEDLDALLTFSGKMNSIEYANLKHKCIKGIESNIRYARNTDEIAFIRKKIDALSEFNSNNPKANLTISIKQISKDLDKKELKINQ